MKAFFDIDTQIDFLFPAGALYVPGAERLIPAVARLNRLAMQKSIPLISTMCAHPENAEEFRVWPPHCVAGTVGQRKPAALLVGASQAFLEKNELDLFSNPAAERLVDELNIDECCVYGVALDHCVRCAVLGLLKRGRRVHLVLDAVAAVSKEAGDRALQDFAREGGSPYEVCQSSQLE
ncbi:MAG: isochorismatase family protein [Acidobacteriota bacterium]|nr:isochorismatase family protein [Acidobacteriota bacterium]